MSGRRDFDPSDDMPPAYEGGRQGQTVPTAVATPYTSTPYAVAVYGAPPAGRRQEQVAVAVPGGEVKGRGMEGGRR